MELDTPKPPNPFGPGVGFRGETSLGGLGCEEAGGLGGERGVSGELLIAEMFSQLLRIVADHLATAVDQVGIDLKSVVRRRHRPGNPSAPHGVGRHPALAVADDRRLLRLLVFRLPLLHDHATREGEAGVGRETLLEGGLGHERIAVGGLGGAGGFDRGVGVGRVFHLRLSVWWQLQPPFWVWAPLFASSCPRYARRGSIRREPHRGPREPVALATTGTPREARLATPGWVCPEIQDSGEYLYTYTIDIIYTDMGVCWYKSSCMGNRMHTWERGTQVQKWSLN